MRNSSYESILKDLDECDIVSGEEYLIDDLIFELERLENLFLDIAYEQLGTYCGTLEELKPLINKLAYEKKLAGSKELKNLNNELKLLHKLIRNLNRGQKGEKIAKDELVHLEIPYMSLDNRRFNYQNVVSEIDKIIVTPKGIFVVEVKNNKQDMILTENGNYKPLNDACDYAEKNLGERMKVHKTFVRSCISSLLDKDIQQFNIPIETILLYVDNNFRLIDNYRYIQICYKSSFAPYINQYQSDLNLTKEQMGKIVAVIKRETMVQRTTVPFDINALKTDFAAVIAMLAEALEEAYIDIEEYAADEILEEKANNEAIASEEMEMLPEESIEKGEESKEKSASIGTKEWVLAMMGLLGTAGLGFACGYFVGTKK